MQFPDQTKRIVGGLETQVVVGAAKFTLPGNLRGYAIRVRTQGTIIAAMEVQDNDGNLSAYAPNWLGIALNQGDYLVPGRALKTITLTAATDSVAIDTDVTF